MASDPIEEIEHRYGPHILRRTAPGEVTLFAPYEHAAAELHARYGDRLRLWVGGKRYPPEMITQAAIPLPVSAPDYCALRVLAQLRQVVAVSGALLDGTAEFSNIGPRRLRVLSGIVTGGLRRPGDVIMAGAFHGAVAAIGYRLELGPGDRQVVPLVVGSDSVLPDRTYLLPPGDYEVVVAQQLPFLDEHGDITGRRAFVAGFGPTVTLTKPTVGGR